MTDVHVPRFADIDQVQHWALSRLLAEGGRVAPRGDPTREILLCSFLLTNPRARKLTSPARNWSEALAVGEFCWHVSGSDDVESLAYYSSAWKSFADADGRVRGSCYGRRIFNKVFHGRSQWELARDLLKRDPSSRRAVVDLQGSLLLHRGDSNDVSCATSMQFLIRDEKLHCSVVMRSNDVIWGLPYDVFLFTMLHEMMAVELGVQLGNYGHFAASLHLYEKHLSLAEKILSEPVRSSGNMAPMADLHELAELLRVELALRRGEEQRLEDSYWSELTTALFNRACNRQKQRV